MCESAATFAFCAGAEGPAGVVLVAVLMAAEDLTGSCAGTAGEIKEVGVTGDVMTVDGRDAVAIRSLLDCSRFYY